MCRRDMGCRVRIILPYALHYIISFNAFTDRGQLCIAIYIHTNDIQLCTSIHKTAVARVSSELYSCTAYRTAEIIYIITQINLVIIIILFRQFRTNIF